MEVQEEPSSSDSHNVLLDIDIPSVAQALDQKLADHRRLLHGGSQTCTPTIGLVPDLTRNVDEHEYNPQYVSIGPYHRNRTPNISRFDDKLASLYTVLSASRRSGPGTTVEAYLAELAEIEDRARSFYAHGFHDMKRSEFLQMLFLDACYVLVCFGNVGIPENGSPVANGHVQGGYQDSNKLEAGISVVRDVLYLAENQIPYLVVDKIDSLTFSGGRAPAVKAIAGNISEILQKLQYSMATVVEVDGAPPAEPINFLHLLHMHFPKPTTVPYSATGEPVRRCRTAMEYYISGVNFKSRGIGGAGTKEARCILDVMFDSGTGTLVLPRLNMDAETLRILRNLMAFEQQNPGVGSHVTAYCVFMSQLACTARDVELLSRKRAIVHVLGNNDEVAGYFSDLCKGVLFDANDPDRNYLRAAFQELDKCYRSRRRRWMALLRQKYFASPWLAIGVLAAAVVLLCTLVQAVYAVLSYNQAAAK